MQNPTYEQEEMYEQAQKGQAFTWLKENLEPQLEAMPGKGDLEMGMPEPPVSITSDALSTPSWFYPRFQTPCMAWIAHFDYSVGGTVAGGSGLATYLDLVQMEAGGPNSNADPKAGGTRTDIYVRGGALSRATNLLYNRFFRGLGKSDSIPIYEDPLPVTGTPLIADMIFFGRWNWGPTRWKIQTKTWQTGFGAASTRNYMNISLIPVFTNKHGYADARYGGQTRYDADTRVIGEVASSDSKFQIPWNPGIKQPFLHGATAFGAYETTIVADLTTLSRNGVALNPKINEFYERFSRSVVRSENGWKTMPTAEIDIATIVPYKWQLDFATAKTPTLVAIYDQ